MGKTIRAHLVEGKSQIASLASATRQEIVDVLPRLGTASVAEIAAALGRPPDGMYYHMRALQGVGLVVAAGHRNKAGRREALFRAVAQQVELRLEPRSPEKIKGATAIVGSMLRMGMRDYRRALKDPEAVLTGPKREVWPVRTTGWLTAAQVAKVNRLIQRLIGDVSESKGPGRLYGITIVFTQLEHRSRERK